jgi:outer membrane protein
MKFLHLCLLFWGLNSIASPEPVRLQSAFESALKKNESASIATAQVDQADARESKAFGQVLPQISLIGNYLRQDAPTNTASSQLKPDQSSARINLTQPIFHGLSDIYAYRATQALARSKKASEFAARLALYTSVAAAYYGVLSSEKDRENLKSILELTEKRVGELKQRTKIGRSRRGELLASESQSAVLKAQLEAAVVAASNARDNFQFITGLPAESPLYDDPSRQQGHSPSLELYLNMVEKRPDVEAVKETYEASDQLVGAAKGIHWPAVDFSANYYLHRTGSLSASKWDLGITATLPLFAGFSHQSAIRETVSKRKEDELRLAQIRRQAFAEIKTLYQSFKGTVAQNNALELAVQTSEANYKQQQKDYGYGLVTNLEVLQSLNQLQEARRNLDRTHYQARLALIQLQAAAGQLP